jgi:hypothetical protein
LGYWDIGILGYWDIGILGYWDIGILGYWDIGILGYWGKIKNQISTIINRQLSRTIKAPCSTMDLRLLIVDC